MNEKTLLTTQWRKKVIPPLIILLEHNGATSGVMAVETATYGEVYKLSKNEYKREGYAFDGWSRSTNSVVAYQDESSIGLKNEAYENPFNLYARWVATKSIAARLILHGNGGTFSGSPIATYNLAYGEEIHYDKPVMEGHRLVRWRKDSVAGPIYNIPNECNFREDRHLYAEYEENTYYVVYNSNNGRNDVMQQG